MLQLDRGAVLLEPMATIASRRPTAVNGYPRPKVVANRQPRRASVGTTDTRMTGARTRDSDNHSRTSGTSESKSGRAGWRAAQEALADPQGFRGRLRLWWMKGHIEDRIQQASILAPPPPLQPRRDEIIIWARPRPSTRRTLSD